MPGGPTRRKHAWWTVALFGILASSVACSQGKSGSSSAGAGGTSGAGGNETPLLDGFERYRELGATCRAAVAVAPADHYGGLTFMPCLTGDSAGCGELLWDGPVSWDPTGTGDLLLFSLQALLDESGAVRRLLVTHQYSTRSTPGIPYEAVAYDVPSGAPLAAFRNLGDEDDFDVPRPAGGDCTINVGIGESSALVLGKPSGSDEVSFAIASLDRPSEARTFTAVGADESVMDRPLVAGATTVAFEQEDGRLHRVDLATGSAASSYGPALRLWLSAVSGGDVLTRGASPSVDGHYWFDGPDSFRRIPIDTLVMLADAARLVWVVSTALGHDVYVAPRTAADPAAAAVLVGSVTAEASMGGVVTATLGDATLALRTAEVGGLLGGASTVEVHLVDLATGTVRRRSYEPGASYGELLANGDGYVLLGVGSGLAETGQTQFQAIRRIEVPEP